MFRWLINLVRPPFVSAKLNKWKALRDAKRQDFLENYYTRIDED